jgi:hypothetical protein
LRCPFEPCAVRLVAGERLLVGDGSVYAGGQAQARFGGVGAGLRTNPVDRPSGGEHGDLVLEAGAVRWREVGEERGVHDADCRVCRGGRDEGGQKRGGVSGVDRGGRACRGGAEGAVEEAGAAGVVGPDQGAEPGRVIGVKRVQRVRPRRAGRFL